VVAPSVDGLAAAAVSAGEVAALQHELRARMHKLRTCCLTGSPSAGSRKIQRSEAAPAGSRDGRRSPCSRSL